MCNIEEGFSWFFLEYFLQPCLQQALDRRGAEQSHATPSQKFLPRLSWIGRIKNHHIFIFFLFFFFYLHYPPPPPPPPKKTVGSLLTLLSITEAKPICQSSSWRYGMENTSEPSKWALVGKTVCVKGTASFPPQPDAATGQHPTREFFQLTSHPNPFWTQWTQHQPALLPTESESNIFLVTKVIDVWATLMMMAWGFKPRCTWKITVSLWARFATYRRKALRRKWKVCFSNQWLSAKLKSEQQHPQPGGDKPDL